MDRMFKKRASFQFSLFRNMPRRHKVRSSEQSLHFASFMYCTYAYMHGEREREREREIEDKMYKATHQKSYVLVNAI